MSFETIRQSAETKIQSWGGLPIAYDNVRFDSNEHDAWVKIVVLDGDSFAGSLAGSCKIKRTGLIGISINTKQWEGSKAARVYADEISAEFSNTRDGSITYNTAYANRVGYANDVFRLNVYVPFTYHEV